MTEPSAEIEPVVVLTATVDDGAEVDRGPRPADPVEGVEMPSPTTPKAVSLDELTERLVLHRAGSGADVASWLAGHALVTPAEEVAR
jgi:hypothetical protein